ncbi:hypothetical protein NKG94_02100 [Micromonospora sp. M12]
MLKTLDRARADGDRVYAVIEGSAVRTGSGDGGLTVPSAAVQTRTIGAALDDAGLRPEQVQYVELHGTGTQVGDPIEAEALGAAYGRGGRRRWSSVRSRRTSGISRARPASRDCSRPRSACTGVNWCRT